MNKFQSLKKQIRQDNIHAFPKPSKLTFHSTLEIYRLHSSLVSFESFEVEINTYIV